MERRQITRVVKYLDDCVEQLVMVNAVHEIPEMIFGYLTNAIALLENELRMEDDEKYKPLSFDTYRWTEKEEED